MASAAGLWDLQKDAARLLDARTRYGHNQGECAGALRRLGLGGADQPSVSAWESGKRRPHPQTAVVIRQYIERAPGRSFQDGHGDRDDLAFADVVRSVTGERPIGPIGELAIKSMLEHLRSMNGQMGEGEIEGWRDIKRFLGW